MFGREKKKSIFIAQTHLEPEALEKKIITVDNYVFPPDAGKYTIMNYQTYLARLHKHDIQMNQISFSREIFDDFRKSINDALKEQREIDEWNNYLECDGYPHTYVPSEIREYLTKIELFEKELAEKTDSWLLSIDERSMLNQDMEAKFFTKNALKNNKIDYGNNYDYFIGKLLGVLKRLENTLKTRYKVKNNVFGDLNELRISTHFKIKDLIEKLTYKVVSNTESQMKAITVQTSEFVCSTDNFKMYIWTFNNIPITLDNSRFQKVNINVDCMTAKISLPYHVLEPNLTLRIIQLNYDHYSEFVASYHDVPNPFRTNFRQVLIMDWEKKCELQLKIKKKLTEERAEYEEYLIAKAEFEAKLKAQKKAPTEDKPIKKKQGKKKIVAVPPEIEADQYPDVDADFYKEEDEIYANVMDNLHPRKYNFEENELNMRQFIPLGGIYEFNFLSKPSQIIYPFIAAGLKTDVIPCILKGFVKKCPRKEGAEIDSIASEIDERKPKVLAYYVITVQIPTKYVKWAEPIPCQFITGYDIIPHLKRDEKRSSSPELVKQTSSQETRRPTKKGRRNTTSLETHRSKSTSRRTVRKSKKLLDSDYMVGSSETDFTDTESEIKEETNFSIVAIGTIRTTRKPEDLETTTKWTTKFILKKKFDIEKGEMKIWTDRLGIFAFMYPRYIHFPYKNWSITAKSLSEVTYDIDSPLAKYRFKITDKGYTVLVSNFYEKFSDRKTYLQILNPISDIDELKYTMIEQNLNIFPNIDAGYYLEGHLNQKYFALENHIYDCMSAYSTFIQFHRSKWNCLAGYRNILLHTDENSTDPKEAAKPLHLILQNLDEARYVTVEEVCTDISEVVLRYKTARETDYCADLFNLITTSYPGSFFSRLRNAKLFLYVSEILKATKPLSFS